LATKKKRLHISKGLFGGKNGTKGKYFEEKKIEFVICKLYLENVAKIMGFQKKSTLLYDI
jgi:hypothetical protein